MTNSKNIFFSEITFTSSLRSLLITTHQISEPKIILNASERGGKNAIESTKCNKH